MAVFNQSRPQSRNAFQILLATFVCISHSAALSQQNGRFCPLSGLSGPGEARRQEQTQPIGAKNVHSVAKKACELKRTSTQPSAPWGRHVLSQPSCSDHVGNGVFWVSVVYVSTSASLAGSRLVWFRLTVFENPSNECLLVPLLEVIGFL